MEENHRSVRSNPIALLPIIVFLVLYLGCGLLFEYGLNIEQGFYQTPAIVIFLIALAVACFQNRKLDFNAKLKVMANGVADENILTMCLVFLAAGAFSGAISAAGGADSTVFLFLDFLPSQFAVAGLFLIACFVSVSMGTSVGTVSALAPFAVSMSEATGFDIVLCIAYLVVVSTVIAQVFQTIAIQNLPTSEASVILSTECIFAMLVSVIFTGETLTVPSLCGFALIFGAILLSEIQLPSAKRQRGTTEGD